MTITNSNNSAFNHDLDLNDALAVIQWCAARNHGVRMNFTDTSYSTTPGTPKVFSTSFDFRSSKDRDDFAAAFPHLV